MSTILILYGTTEGHTLAIAERIAEVARERGHRVEVRNGQLVGPGFSFAGYDAAIVGASIHAGKHEGYILDLIRAHRDELADIPTAFFSVSLAAGTPGDAEQARLYAEEFQRATGWHPGEVRTFGGALLYTQYGWPKRMLMKLIARQKGIPTDTSRDYDFTDWDAVAHFAEEFLAHLAPPAAVLEEATTQPVTAN